MSSATTTAARVARYELEVAIEAPRDVVWKTIVDDTNAWWLPEFHMIGEGSVVTFDLRAGGHLIEHLEGTGSLLWATVHMCQPEQFTVYLVGHTAADWGGPTTSSMKLVLEATDEESCVLKVSDALHGQIDETNIEQLRHGWTWLFTDGLKKFVETGHI
jgi:uncharacterized protein YndB with AHSA1/START domain